MSPEAKYLFFHQFHLYRLGLALDHVNLFSVVVDIVINAVKLHTIYA